MKQLQNLSIVAPGFYGLNSQEAGVTLSSNFAQTATNVVIDKYGRLGARKGWSMQTTSGSTQLSGSPIRFLLEHNASGASVFLSAGNNKVFSGGVAATLTDITPSLYTITDNDWSGASLYDRALMVQEGHEPLIYDATATPVLQTITDYTGSTQNYGTSYPHYAIAAYGRFWTHNKDAVYWSTDIADTAFPCFCGGTSGSLNISAVLPDNFDDIVAIAVHNDFLVILCKHNIVLYSGASNPIGNSFQLADIITGVGCVAKNSVQATGNDLIFLSDTGVRSLGRLITEKSLPMRDLTKNVRDEVLQAMQDERDAYLGSLDHVCSVYSEANSFYLISFPSINTIYVLDMRTLLQDGAARITKWKLKATAFLRTKDRDVLLGVEDGIGKYTGYTDNNASYDIEFLSHFLDFQNPTQTKILKQLKSSIIGGYGQVFVITVGIDYTTNLIPYSFTISSGSVPAYYNVSKYSIGEYSGAIDLSSLKSSIGGAGNIIQIGFKATINNAPLSVQSLDCFLATGRIK